MRRRALLALLLLPALAAAQSAAPPLTARANDPRECLFGAVQDGKVETVRALLEKAPPHGWPGDDLILCLTCLGGTPDEMLAVARLLVEGGAKVDSPLLATTGTPLLHALEEAPEPVALVRFLLEEGADPNGADEDGNTPLHLAVHNGFAASVAELLAHGARVEARTHDRRDDVLPGQIPPSTSRNHPGRVLDLTARMYVPTFWVPGKTPIFGLAERFDPAVAALLLKAGAKLDERNVHGWTPLHDAAHSGNLAAVRGLLALGADPNAASNAGLTPLHVAMRAPDHRLIAATAALLLAAGADPRRTDRDGQTPLDLLRADVRWRFVGFPRDPGMRIPSSARGAYLAHVNQTARLLDPRAAPIVYTPMKPGPEGIRGLHVFFGDLMAERNVKVENGHAVLELRFFDATERPSTLTFRAVALEGYDTLTPLPVVVRRVDGRESTVRFTFPLGAEQGDTLDLDCLQQGPGVTRAVHVVGQGQGGKVGFATGDPVAVEHLLAGRTLEMEILSVARGGRSLPGFAGRVLRVESGRTAAIAGLRVDSHGDPKRPRTTVRYRYRFLPNVRWRTDSIAL